MNAKNFELAEGLVKHTYIQQAAQGRRQRENLTKVLLAEKRLPEDGWDDATIELFLAELANMDSNNFVENVGVGEREGRIFSDIVARRNFRLAHGIGRSGDLAEVQPKAAGSSLMYKLTNRLVLDVIKTSGITRVENVIVVPMATGMTMSLFLLYIRSVRPTAKYVIWPRIDQKTCLKCIATAGYSPIVVHNVLEGDELRTDLEKIKSEIAEYGAENIACIISTTSCFAPRGYDKVVEIAQIAKECNIPHLINNAYGLQASKCTHAVNEAIRLGRVDAFVQSTDKNFMVPVGGAVLASSNSSIIDAFAKTYAGRASSGPIMDVFITLLSMGRVGWKKLLAERKEYFEYLKAQIAALAARHSERVLVCPNNTISLAMTLDTFGPNQKQLGAILFNKCVSGCRALDPKETKEVSGIKFQSYGSHYDNYPNPYLTVACAIGVTKKDIDVFMRRLSDTLQEYKKKRQAHTTTPSEPTRPPEQVPER